MSTSPDLTSVIPCSVCAFTEDSWICRQHIPLLHTCVQFVLILCMSFCNFLSTMLLCASVNTRSPSFAVLWGFTHVYEGGILAVNQLFKIMFTWKHNSERQSCSGNAGAAGAHPRACPGPLRESREDEFPRSHSRNSGGSLRSHRSGFFLKIHSLRKTVEKNKTKTKSGPLKK